VRWAYRDLVHHRFFGVPITNPFSPGAQSKSRTNAPLSASADLDDYDLEEVTLCAHFRESVASTKKAFGSGYI
jgi:hypothetical protein